MATYDEFQRAKDDGKVHDFSPRGPNGRAIRGRVVGRGVTRLSTADGGTERPWKIEDEQGKTYEVASDDYDID